MSNFETLNRELNKETQELAEKIKNEQAQERDRNRLVEIIYPKLKYYIFKFFNDNDHTEEALHNVIEKIFKNFHQYDVKWKFTTWIYNIAKNEALLYKHKLKQKQTVQIDNLFGLNHVDDSNVAIDKEDSLSNLYEITVKAIMALPEGIEKDILIDKEINQLKGIQISEKHDMNLNTVKTKLRKARKTIRDTILSTHPHLTETIEQYL
jgi:RNA polymerase sigma-70 factor (ECF subfamily)